MFESVTAFSARGYQDLDVELKPHVLIQIYDVPSRIKPQASCIAHDVFCFQDVTDLSPSEDELIRVEGIDGVELVCGFSKEAATRMSWLIFDHQIQQRPLDLVVICDKGRSRSVAVAEAVGVMLEIPCGYNASIQHRGWNKTVYREMLKALTKAFDVPADDELDHIDDYEMKHVMEMFHRYVALLHYRNTSPEVEASVVSLRDCIKYTLLQFARSELYDRGVWSASTYYQLGLTVMRFIDRMGDTCSSDDGEKICAEAYAALTAVIPKPSYQRTAGDLKHHPV